MEDAPHPQLHILPKLHAAAFYRLLQPSVNFALVANWKRTKTALTWCFLVSQADFSRVGVVSLTVRFSVLYLVLEAVSYWPICCTDIWFQQILNSLLFSQ